VARLLQLASGEDWDYCELELDAFNAAESYLVLKLLDLLDLGPLGSYTKLTLTLLTGAIREEEIERRREDRRAQAGEQAELFPGVGPSEDHPPGAAGLPSCS